MPSSSSWSQAVQSLSSEVLGWSGLGFSGSSQEYGLTSCSVNLRAASWQLSWIRPQSSLFPEHYGDSDEAFQVALGNSLSSVWGEESPTHMIFPKEWGRAHGMRQLSPKSLTSSPITLTCLYFQRGWRVKKKDYAASFTSFCIMFGVYSFPCCSVLRTKPSGIKISNSTKLISLKFSSFSLLS